MRNTSVRVSAAYSRSGNLLRELNNARSRQKQMLIIVKQTIYSGPIGWTGGAFDLNALLDDLSFKIPHRTRRASEEMITEGLERHNDLIAISKSQARDARREMLFRWVPSVVGITIMVMMILNIEKIMSFVDYVATSGL